ncbi:DegT/DnrJ/EryC1/StrS family aminotransferase [Streptomyces sp. NPDC058665]|uniref:DegT/DnrJ/EryC1/StrS family aminotransferase n=1 Tax=Streptomyces sp. NPDC058665 TaxID=3346586 RepID=UPI003662AD9E
MPVRSSATSTSARSTRPPPTSNARCPPRTKAVLVLHYGGYPGDIAAIAALCQERGIPLIEDAACAVASTADGTACGAFGDVAMRSFDSMKVLVTGDGGMLYVKDRELALRARQLAYHGLERSSGFANARVSHRWWELNVRDFGRRVVGNDITAAIGSVQLRRLPDFVARRREIAETYDWLLSGAAGVRLPPALPAGHTSSYYFYWVQLDPAVRDQVAADLLDQGVYTTLRYPPLHKVPGVPGRLRAAARHRRLRREHPADPPAPGARRHGGARHRRRAPQVRRAAVRPGPELSGAYRRDRGARCVRRHA